MKPTRNKLEQVRARIIELVPEIMELKFGCVLHNKRMSYNEQLAEIQNLVSYEERNKPGEVDVFYTITENELTPSRWANLNTAFNDDIEIIGRPITLEDVLRAMDETGRQVYAHSKGSLIDFENSSGVVWHLGKPLDEQSEETIAFIGNVLGI